jgi:hypothetical protein
MKTYAYLNKGFKTSTTQEAPTTAYRSRILLNLNMKLRITVFLGFVHHPVF